MKFKNRAHMLTTCAIMFATIFVAMMLDKALSLGLPTGISTAVCVTLVTFTFCFVFNRWDLGVFAGLFFGLASWIKGLIFGEIFNLNPFVPIPARILAGFVAFCVYKLVLKLLKNQKSQYFRQTLSLSVATFFGLVTNTVFYLLALNLYKQWLGDDYSSIFVIIKAVIFTNIMPEYLVSILLAPHIVIGIRRGLRFGVEAVEGFEQEENLGQQN